MGSGCPVPDAETEWNYCARDHARCCIDLSMRENPATAEMEEHWYLVREGMLSSLIQSRMSRGMCASVMETKGCTKKPPR